jgi:delta-aminolevulinic acid dehydratase/porphobilinogen synthase
MLGKRAILRDYHEGSDIILVKPMLAYLDMIREASDSVSTMY